MVSLAVIILTHNEERHLARALSSVRNIAAEVFVIDSFSTDGTPDIARSGGAVVLQNRFINYSEQFRWALENAPVTADWVMRLDADECIEPGLVAEIERKLPLLPASVAGINLKRKHIFLGRWIRHGGRYPLILLRVWRRGQARIESRWMDEHMIVSGGDTVLFEGNFVDENLNDITFFVDKHNKYAVREAIDVLNQRHDLFRREADLSSKTASKQAAARRFLKERLYNRMPFWLSSPAYFLFRYFLQLGFLDGREGLIYHFLQGFWYRFLVGAKVLEYERSLASCSTRDEKIAAIARLTGHRIDAGIEN